MRTCLGGTFEPLHAGHKALLREAAAGSASLFVGITDGKLAARPDRTVSPWSKRADVVKRELAKLGYKGELVVKPLTDGIGPAATGAYDRIVVSPETAAAADSINKQRKKGKLPPLEVVVVPHVLADDLLPISATRIAAGLIDANGKRRTPIRVAVGSANPIKVRAAQDAVANILRVRRVETRPFPVASGVPEQPRDGEILEGARNRANAAHKAWPEADYAVGVEAGLSRDPDGDHWYEVQACVVVDRDGWETRGWGPAFQYPDWVNQRALKGEMVSDILGPVANDPRIGSTTGAIGFLSDGRMDRTELTRIAVLMAFLPRIRRRLYTGSKAEP